VAIGWQGCLGVSAAARSTGDGCQQAAQIVMARGAHDAAIYSTHERRRGSAAEIRIRAIKEGAAMVGCRYVALNEALKGDKVQVA
jgi:hypothetical protein